LEFGISTLEFGYWILEFSFLGINSPIPVPMLVHMPVVATVYVVVAASVIGPPALEAAADTYQQ
jgi:hypothetical protein